MSSTKYSKAKSLLIATGLDLLRSYDASFDADTKVSAEDLRTAIYAIEILLQEKNSDSQGDSETDKMMDAFASLRFHNDTYERNPSEETNLRIQLKLACESLESHLGNRELHKPDDSLSLVDDPLRIPRLILNKLQLKKEG